MTVPPLKKSNMRSEIRFPEWLESLRKDVECAFGILKGRWRILKYGIRFHSVENCDRTWLTCCALHNMLLETDGLAEVWGAEHERDEQTRREGDFARRRLWNPSLRRDLSGSGVGNDCERTGVGNDCERTGGNNDRVEETPIIPNNDGSINVCDLSLNQFRSHLIRHFNIEFLENNIKWPSKLF